MSDHAERKHSRYSPSQMERLGACPGSDRAAYGVVRMDSVWSIEGTKAHTVLEAAIENRIATAAEAHRDYSSLCMEELDVKTGGPYVDFYSAIDAFLEEFYSILALDPDAVVFSETYVVPPSEVAPGETGGYCDLAIFSPVLRKLWIIDYKHGAGVAKSAKNDKQIRQYAAGFLYDPNSPLMQYAVEAFGDKIVPVDIAELVIVQPRAIHVEGPIRRELLTPWQVYEYLDEMDQIIARCQAEDAPLIPDDPGDPYSVRQCQFCPINTNCPAREAKALAAVSQTFQRVEDVTPSGIPDPALLDAPRVEQAMVLLPALRAFMKSIERRFFELMVQGYNSQHFKLVYGEARRRWDGEIEHVATQLGTLTGQPPENFIRRSLMTITDAESMVVDAYKSRAPRGKKRDAATDGKRAMALLTIKEPSGSITIAPLSDDRPAIDRAKTNFAQIGYVLQSGSSE